MSEKKCSEAGLYNADPGCNGRVIALASGVKCDTCKGWFCF